MAAVRFAFAVSSCAWASVGSTFASTWSLVTVSPTLTRIEVTVPEVTKSAAAVFALCTDPEAVAVETTVPCDTATVRDPPTPVAAEVVAVAGAATS